MDAWIVGHTNDKVRILDKTPGATVQLYDYDKDEVYSALRNNKIAINNIYTLSLFHRQCNENPDLDDESQKDKFIVAEILINNILEYQFRIMTPDGKDSLIDAEVFLKDRALIKNAINIRIFRNSDLGSTLALKSGDYYYITTNDNKKEFNITYSKKYKDRNRRFFAKMGLINGSLDDNTELNNIYKSISSDAYEKENSEFMYSLYKDMELVAVPHLDIDFSKLTTKYLPTEDKLSLQAEIQAYRNKSPNAFGNMFIVLWGILKNFPNCANEAMDEIDTYNDRNYDNEMYEYTYVLYTDAAKGLRIVAYDTSQCAESGFVCVIYKNNIIYAVKQEIIDLENNLIDELEKLESKGYTYNMPFINYNGKYVNITSMINNHKAWYAYIDADTNNETEFIIDGISTEWELSKNLRRLIIDRRMEVAVEKVKQGKYRERMYNKHYYLDLLDGTLVVLTSNIGDGSDENMVISKINHLYQFNEWNTNKDILKLIGKRLSLV